MAYILHIETSTKQCSVALAFKGKTLTSRVLNSELFRHNEKLHLFISEVLEEANLKPKQLDAISVSKGPGSYTGLRIGVAAAKGFVGFGRFVAVKSVAAAAAPAAVWKMDPRLVVPNVCLATVGQILLPLPCCS